MISAIEAHKRTFDISSIINECIINATNRGLTRIQFTDDSKTLKEANVLLELHKLGYSVDSYELPRNCYGETRTALQIDWSHPREVQG